MLYYVTMYNLPWFACDGVKGKNSEDKPGGSLMLHLTVQGVTHLHRLNSNTLFRVEQVSVRPYEWLLMSV